MRIFCALRHSVDPTYFNGGLWIRNFYPALRELGHEIIESQTDLLPTSRFMGVAEGFTREEMDIRAWTTERILDEVRAAQRSEPVHLFLSYFYNAHFDPTGFDELRARAIPSVNFYCNSIHQFAQVAAIAAKADFAWHAERDARAKYLAVGAKPVWMQMGADPSVYHPVKEVVRQGQACFVGQRYADRDRWIAALSRANVPVDVYGAGWDASDAAASTTVLPLAKTYLGRKQYRPGSIASYGHVLRETFAREGLFGGASRFARQWKHRRETRELTPLVEANARGWVKDIAQTFAAYEVCLNFSNVWADGRPGSTLIPHVRLRDFEAPMCRTCYLTGHTDEIGEFYDIGKEIETYRSADELVDKARFYLSNPAQAERLRNAGHLRAVRDHTWVRRFKELFQKIGLGSAKASAAATTALRV